MSSTNYNAPNLVIPYVIPSDIPAPLLPLFKPLYNAFQNIIQAFINYCGISPRSPTQILSSAGDSSAILANNVHRFYVQSSEDIGAGAAVNLWPQIGIIFARNANATDASKPCDGFCSQTGGMPNGTVGEVILNDGVNTQVAGLVVGTRYYLSTVDGSFTAIPPMAAGNLQQSLGIALSTNILRFFTGPQIQH